MQGKLIMRTENTPTTKYDNDEDYVQQFRFSKEEQMFNIPEEKKILNYYQSYDQKIMNQGIALNSLDIIG